MSNSNQSKSQAPPEVADDEHSIDSFVLDRPDGPEEIMDAADEFARYYLSPASATDTESGRSKQPTPPAAYQDTIDAVAGHARKISSDSGKPAAQNFFTQSYFEDSDASGEGSLVFKDATLPADSKKSKGPSSRRDRFPSFDSVGSSGSVRFVPKSSSTTQAPEKPAILPYERRRRMMAAQAKREKKVDQPRLQQQQQQQTRGPPAAPPPRPPGMHFVPPPGQPPDMNFHPGYPPPPHHMMFPPQFPPGMPIPPQMAPNFQMPPGTPPNAMFPPYPYPPMGYQYPFPPPGSPVAQQQHMYAEGRQAEPPRQQQQRPPKSASSPRATNQSQRRPPMPQSRDFTSSSAGSSFDSSDGVEGRKDAPPPPPPKTAPPRHIRQESGGSLSSLGSVERGEDNNNNSSRRGGFFSWSPSNTSNKEPNVDDFRRQSQAFLSTVERPKTDVSMQPSQHQRVGSLDRPPTSRGGHRRLPSIDNDDWEEGDNNERKLSSSRRRSDESVSSSEFTGDDQSEPDERTRLLPAGISSNEYYDTGRRDEGYYQSNRKSSQQRSSEDFYSRQTERHVNHARSEVSAESERRRRRKAKKKEKRSRRHRDGDSSPSGDSSVSSREYREWIKTRAKLLEKEKRKMLKKLRSEMRAEEEEKRRIAENNRFHRRLQRAIAEKFQGYFHRAFKFFAWAESFIGNLPLTIGAIALAVANLGVDWFKFAEENLDSCEPVHFHSAQCTFPEFPGCFYCDTNAKMYKLAVNFHFVCSTFAAMLAFAFVAKLLVARQVVFDELGSPTTASPAGLICMTMDVVFAGRGFLGMIVVSISSAVHLCLAIWFIYLALAYHIMPEPSWFPNTVGIGISAVKTWLYHPMAGHFLMAISLSLNFFFFPISLIRVALNRKISATVGWMQMSAPNVSLYALTIMAQPSFVEEHPDINNFQKVHRRVYLPLMHLLFGLCLVGMVASVTSLVVRWKEFRKLRFSPAHAAFCVPTLSHANAVQAYRAAINSFSDLPPHSNFRLFIYTYWLFVLIGGTIVTLIIAAKFLYSLPAWTHIDLTGEIEPPGPNQTAMKLSDMLTTGETLVQSYVSPIILQANETGALVLTRDREGHQRFVRTRQVTALGFEPMMGVIEMERERELLLEWVGKHPPRRRHRTLSVPGIDFNYGTGNAGVYGMEEGVQQDRSSRQRANTAADAPRHRRLSHG